MYGLYLLQQHLHLLTAVEGREVRVQRLRSREVIATSPSPSVPLLAGQHLGELRLLYLQVVQAALELADPYGVYRQVLVDLRGQQPQNRVCVGLSPLILDYKLGHSCQCKHLHTVEGGRGGQAADE